MAPFFHIFRSTHLGPDIVSLALFKSSDKLGQLRYSSLFFYYLQATMKNWILSYFKYIRLSYNVIVVSICAKLYCRCILTLRSSRVNRRNKLLTFVFAGNLISWVLTVVPHLVFLDFVMNGMHLMVQHYFVVKMMQIYFDNFLGAYLDNTQYCRGCFSF